MATRSVLSLGLALALAGCTSTATNSTRRTTAAAPTSTSAAPLAPRSTSAASALTRNGRRVGRSPRCRPPTPIHRSANLPPEVQGSASRGQLWGLLFLQGDSIRAGDEVKIVWRMTGHGDIRLTATAPNGRQAPLAWGPEPHLGSSYQRPGEEWGAGYRFTRPGCWTLTAARDDTKATVWLVAH